MTGWDDESLIEDLVANGVDDWVYEALVCGNIARRRASDPQERRAIALGLIAEALFSGLMVPGSVNRDGFVPWHCSLAESFERIATAWLNAPDPDVRPGEVVWLSNTESGNRLGEAVLRREGHSGDQ